MTSNDAKRYVIIAMVLTGVVASMGDVMERSYNLPRLRIYIGAVIAAVILTLLAGGLPELAASLAVLILISAMFLQWDVIKKLGQLVGG